MAGTPQLLSRPPFDQRRIPGWSIRLGGLATEQCAVWEPEFLKSLHGPTVCGLPVGTAVDGDPRESRFTDRSTSLGLRLLRDGRFQSVAAPDAESRGPLRTASE